MKSRFFPIAAFVGVFVLGGVAGAGASRAYMLQQFGSPLQGPPHEVRAHLRIEAMRRQLDLSPQQVGKIKTMFHDTNDEFDGAMKPCREQLETLRKRTDERIVETLDSAQRVKFKEFSDKMHKRMRHGPFPPPPPN